MNKQHYLFFYFRRMNGSMIGELAKIFKLGEATIYQALNISGTEYS
ncbi:hypothetical protein [Proteus myxofaciens]|nr:hypothetical protein [Proteus myxofaciens]